MVVFAFENHRLAIGHMLREGQSEHRCLKPKFQNARVHEALRGTVPEFEQLLEGGWLPAGF